MAANGIRAFFCASGKHYFHLPGVGEGVCSSCPKPATGYVKLTAIDFADEPRGTAFFKCGCVTPAHEWSQVNGQRQQPDTCGSCSTPTLPWVVLPARQVGIEAHQGKTNR